MTLASCRPTETVEGIVQDYNTNLPIRNANIYEQNNHDNNTYSDSLGKFKIKALTVVIKKDGYQVKIVSFDKCESEYVLLKAVGQ